MKTLSNIPTNLCHFSLSDFSKYKSSLMGFAILWIMLFHFRANFNDAPLNYISSIGYGGVDVFMFLSGLGGVYSWKGSYKAFYKRRFLRLYPTYLFVLLLSSVLCSNNYSINEFCQAIIKSTGIGYYLFFLPLGYFDWYVPTMYLFYALFPLWLVQYKKNQAWGWIAIAIGFLFTIFLMIIQKGTIILTFSRIPIFILGAIVGTYIRNEKNLDGWTVPTVIISTVAFFSEMVAVNTCPHEFLWRNAVYWLPFYLITPGLCILLCMVFNLFDRIKLKGFNLLFERIGKLSYELFLSHMVFLGFFKAWVLRFCSNECNVWFIFLCFFIIEIVFAVLIKISIDFLIRNIRRCHHILFG